MLDFKKVEAKDKEIFDKYRDKSSRYSESSFVTLYLWDKYYNLHFAQSGENLFVRFTIEGKNQYLFPLGEGDKNEALALLEKEEEGNVVFRFVTDKQKDFLEQNFSKRLYVSEKEDLNDYVYETQRLISLSGKKLHGKKNHVNYFEKTFDYEYEKVTEEAQIKECESLLLKWIDEKTKNVNPIEGDAMKRLFENYNDFEMKGAVIRVDGEIVAMTFGERLTDDTVLIQVEKAREDVRGAYPMINKLFLENEWSFTTFVNREEDMGLEGLKKAKESYYPIFKTRKYQAILRKDD